MSASDSHRAEVREAVSIAIDYAVQGSREYAAKDLEDYYEKRTKWVQSQTDAIMALLDAEQKRWIGEVKALKWETPERRTEPSNRQLGWNDALDAVSRVLDSYNAG